MSINILPRLALIILAGFGTLAGLKLSMSHIQVGEVCPMLGPIPACFIVFIGYLCVLIAAVFVKKAFIKRLFYIGWTPVFLLALMGVIVEVGVMLGLTKDHICPPGAYGIPQCFFSLGMALICLGLFKLTLKTTHAQ